MVTGEPDGMPGGRIRPAVQPDLPLGPGLRRGLLLKLGLAILAVSELSQGLWALAAPRSFYTDFPMPGRSWVAMFPSYNEHLMRDFGGLNLGFAVMFGIAAVVLDLWLVRGALIGFICYALPHLSFHIGHMSGFGTFDVVGQLVSLSFMVLLPAALLLLTRGATGRPRHT